MPDAASERNFDWLAFFGRPATNVARGLIGVSLFVDGVGGTIVETEAYGAEDPASHSFKGPTMRNAAMFGEIGRAYVYKSYGLHWCLNIVCGPTPGSAVLLRAIEPEAGIEVMMKRRGRCNRLELCSGPGQLTEALAVTGALNGQAMTEPPFELVHGVQALDIVTCKRVGITKGVDLPWRFALNSSPYLSRTAK